VNRLTRRSLPSAVALLAILAVSALFVSASGPAWSPDTGELRRAVTAEGLRAHLEALQAIAARHRGTRAVGTPGFAATAEYVRERLRDSGYQVTVQHFAVPYFAEKTPPVLAGIRGARADYRPGVDVRTMDFSGSGDVVAEVVPVGIPRPATAGGASASGCGRGQYARFPAGAVALLLRGGCSFPQKARLARAGGAAAVLIMNDGGPGRTGPVHGTLERPGMGLPVLSVSFPVGAELAGADHPVVHLVAHTTAELRDTQNVLADGNHGRADRVVVVGAHLDSVPAGPGINDDGSGLATVLEMAEQLARLHLHPHNRVRFAFWGAEELGLLGSKHYVDGLLPDQRDRIAVYLNLDMLASPNYARFVYAGDGPRGTDTITTLFTRYVAARRMPVDRLGFDGRSDYAAFRRAGIPVGGVFSGAEKVKTPEQARRYGGTAGRPYDPCYHQACDTVDNVNNAALTELSQAAAHAVQSLLSSPGDPRQ
jgi:hypothetical protein